MVVRKRVENLKSLVQGFLLLGWVILAGLHPPLAHAEKARLSDIVVTSTVDHLLLYVSVTDCFNPDMEKAIENGIPTTFTFFVKLYEKREFWWDRQIADLRISHEVRYDNLKRVYVVKVPERNAEPFVAKDLQEAKALLSEIVGLEVSPLNSLQKGGKYEIRMMAELDKIRLPLYLHYVFFFLSLWDFETDWYTVEFRY